MMYRSSSTARFYSTCISVSSLPCVSTACYFIITGINILRFCQSQSGQGMTGKGDLNLSLCQPAFHHLSSSSLLPSLPTSCPCLSFPSRQSQSSFLSPTYKRALQHLGLVTGIWAPSSKRSVWLCVCVCVCVFICLFLCV